MKHARILVIEDDADTADMLKIFFSSQGSSVDIATTGFQALNAVRTDQPDLIILDIMLPDMDGYSVCKQLRSTPRSRHIPIIFLTQKNGRSDILSGLEIGADDYLTKPFDLEELKLRVRNALQRSRSNRAIDPRTSLPTGELVHNSVSQLLLKPDWAVLLYRIKGFESYRRNHGLLGGDELLAQTTGWLEALARRLDPDNIFIGYLQGGDFLLITHANFAGQLQGACLRQSDVSVDKSPPIVATRVGVPTLQSESDDAQGGSEQAMEIEIGLITDKDGPFEDVQALLQALTDSIHDRNESSDDHV